MKSLMLYHASPVFSSTGPPEKKNKIKCSLSKVQILCNHLTKPISKKHRKMSVLCFYHEAAGAGFTQPTVRLKTNLAA